MMYNVYNARKREGMGLSMTVKELIMRYDIRDGATMNRPGSLFIARQREVTKDNMLDEIKARKAEILACFAAEREARVNARAAREARIKGIEGLKEIQAAIADLAEWRREFNASFDGEGAVGGLGVRKMPEYDIDGMIQRYPRAAAYIRAKEYADKANSELSRIGSRALDDVIDGDWQSAMRQMEKDLDEYADRHLWD